MCEDDKGSKEDTVPDYVAVRRPVQHFAADCRRTQQTTAGQFSWQQSSHAQGLNERALHRPTCISVRL